MALAPGQFNETKPRAVVPAAPAQQQQFAPTIVKNADGSTTVTNIAGKVTNIPADKTSKMIPPPAVVTSEQAKDKVNNISGLITQQDLAGAVDTEGTAGDLADLEGEIDVAYGIYQSTLDRINRGILTPEEQAMLDNAALIFEQTRKAQEKINKNYEAGVTITGIRSGRQRYATEMEQGNIKDAMDQGIAKLAELDAKSQQALMTMRQSMLDKDYERATDAFDAYKDVAKEKRDNIIDLDKLAREDQKMSFDILKEQNQQIREYNKLVAESEKDTRTSDIKEYEYAKSQGYKGLFTDYMAKKQAASKSVSSPSLLTTDEAARYGLPKSVVGTTDLDMIQDLSVSTPPNWFREMMTQQGGGKGKFFFSDAWLKGQWDTFRGSDDMMVYRNMLDINKAYAGELQAEGGGGKSNDNPFQ